MSERASGGERTMRSWARFIQREADQKVKSLEGSLKSGTPGIREHRCFHQSDPFKCLTFTFSLEKSLIALVERVETTCIFVGREIDEF